MSRAATAALAATDRAIVQVEAILKAGHLDRLSEATEAMEAAFGRLSDIPLVAMAESQLAALRIRAAHLSVLLTAALGGARHARSMLTRPSGFSAYDATGRSGVVGHNRPQFERRR